MPKINVNDLSMKDLREFAFIYLPEMTEESIMDLPINTLEVMINEELQNSELSEDEILHINKHSQTRKKRHRRLSGKYTKGYRKPKDKTAKQTRKRVEGDVTNRAYINKASRGYVPNRELYSSKQN